MTIATKLNLSQQSWMTSAGLQKLFAAIEAAGGEARFVGGVVRDVLLGRPVGDIDLAVNLPPEKVTAALTAGSIKVVPTGIAHGTVTAVIDHKGYEITTLRHDVETDGRRAKVAFTDDWQADAARRDFTFNALYATRDGKIYDYFKGRDDLAAGRVRFIGDAEARIREDVLRILRFFRFHAWYGSGAADATALMACQKLVDLLPQLSMERVWKEISKLLIAVDPVATWQSMLDRKILTVLLPEAHDMARLQRLVAVEKEYASPAAERRLAALLAPNMDIAEAVSQRLKMSNHEAEKLQALAVLPMQLRGKEDPVPLRRVIYHHGAENVRDALLLHATEGTGFDLRAALDTVEAWEAPVLPVQGEDILKMGIAAGPRVGEILRGVEEWWQAKDFRATRAECLAEAKKIIG